MSTRSVAEFFSQAERDEVLASRLAAARHTSKEAWLAEVVRIAADAGYRFNPADVDSAVEEQRQMEKELGEDELEQVSGGATYLKVDAIYGEPFYDAWPCKWYVPGG